MLIHFSYFNVILNLLKWIIRILALISNLVYVAVSGFDTRITFYELWFNIILTYTVGWKTFQAKAFLESICFNVPTHFSINQIQYIYTERYALYG